MVVEMKSIIFSVAISLLICDTYCDKLQSPCPHILRYEKLKRNGTWEGLLVLRDQEGLQGISLGITLDSKADTLVNNFGEVTTLNNKNFVINGLDYTLSPSHILKIEFVVKYNPIKSPPNVVSIRLNGVEICSNGLIGNNSVPGQSQLTTTEKTHIMQFDSMCGVKSQYHAYLDDELNMQEFWPWHTAILLIVNTKMEYLCGGTLITDQFVLTVAHCVTVFSKNKVLDKDMLIIYLGVKHLHELGASTVLRAIKSIKIHDEYDPTRYQNNLAIIGLDKPVEFNENIRSVCLWDDEVKIEPIIGDFGTVVGFGKDEDNITDPDLMKANMQIVGLQTCLDHDHNFFSQYISPKTYCAGSSEEGTICGGDSGGGMVIPKLSENGKERMWYIRGVVSVSSRDNVCTAKSYAVFMDVAQYLNWVQENINT